MAVNSHHPFQRVQFVDRQHAGHQNVIVASAGSKLYSYAAETGQRLASWPQDVDHNDAAAPTAMDVEPSVDGQGPPEKKRKVSMDGGSGKPTSASWSSIPLLVTSTNGRYVVAMTVEDKCIRVFRLGEDGSLEQLSERVMPKRGCALSLANNDSIILCGDKFGDVYSLPLIPNEAYVASKATSRQSKKCWPAATALTVHTKGNLASLEQQKRQYEAKIKKTSEEKPSLNFEHQLLIGHVSLLTDLAFVSLPVDSSTSKKRTFILTADRDEHIRVSRGPPQTHVIENYCLGHTSFVSSLCVPTWAPEYLISGGGDNHLLVWKWAESRVLQKVPLVDEASESTDIAVRGIWATSLGNTENPSGALRLILVGIEGSSKLQCFALESNGTLKVQKPVSTSGNVLDVTSNAQESTIFVSVDNVREAGSTQEWRSSPTTTLIEAYRATPETDDLVWESVAESTVGTINASGTSEIPASIDAKQRKEMNDSLYGLGNMRKRYMGEDD
ncbi:hypothetical protein EYZ11_006602 [Aspergillus tanneri]|uniref:tRNA (Guanine-N(7)-)-methyltransferase non-catalytic subunit trm82 n=1 Tax=Aspergillus tanneri TaxID=1220188 RepID=A0A4S3JFF8_9EURO|nr:tRNA (guanine-N(7)-)-methyltransferase non-catalytic subunit trm82 [Aspergillus tanneri]KAA8643506.1 tRNA (guanine-N(7)-)-methyltransferase non-catalytic subunit trm82 [Aspergillus tanneri]THC93920.1 hypothetical protein EYZ11_006602 [Aspergillus tanneri]